MEVPATRKAHVVAPGDAHEHDRSKGILSALHGMLQGRKQGAGSRNRRHAGRGPLGPVMPVVAPDDDGDPYAQLDQPMGGDVHET